MVSNILQIENRIFIFYIEVPIDQISMVSDTL
jgi:hypothetical protein